MLILALWMPGARAHGQDMPVTSDHQLSLLSNVLTFDRNFKERVGAEVVVGILYQTDYRQSLLAKNQLLAAAKEQNIQTIGGVPARFVELPYLGSDALSAALRDADVDLLYVTPLRAASFASIERTCRAEHVATLTGVPEYVDEGIAVGIGTRGGRPEIVVNLAASQALGMDFSARLLRLARVVQ